VASRLDAHKLSPACTIITRGVNDLQPGRTIVGDRLSQVVNAICEWLYPKGCRQSRCMLRAYTFVWFMRPDWLGNPSQVELSERLHVSKQTLGKVVNQLRNRFQFYVAGMRGDEARRKFAAHAKAHAKQLAEARRRANRARG
jgi:hypothetical protein